MAESQRGLSIADRARLGEDERSNVAALVQAFEDVLQSAQTLPPLVMVPATHRRRGYRRFVHSFPRPRLFLRFFVVDHAQRTLDVIRRRLLVAAALQHDTADSRDRETVGLYLDGLPPHRRTLYSTTLVVLTIVLTQVVLLATPGAIAAFGGTGMAQYVDEIGALLQTIEHVSSDLRSLGSFIDALRAPPLATVAFVLTSLLTVLYVELRPFVPGYRLKRAMFNLYPRPEDVSSTPAPWSVQRATGLYDVERSVVRQTGAPTRREVPFDLIVPALLMPSLLYLGSLLIANGRFELVRGEQLLSYLFGTALMAGAFVRLGWLTRAWLRRSRREAGPYLPSEVRIRGTQLVLALRDPHTIVATTGVLGALCVGVSIVGVREFGQGALGFVSALDVARLLILGLVIAPIWYRINRDVSAYLAVRGAPRPGRPWLSLLAMATGWLGAAGSGRPFMVLLALVATGWVLVSVYQTGDRIRRAESIAIERDGHLLPPAVLAAGFVAFPFVLGHIQQALNATLRSDGDVLD